MRGLCWNGALALVACDKARDVHGDTIAAGAIAQCTRCHGDPARIASSDTDPLVAAAPPRGFRGAADPAVGAHQAHLRAGPLAAALRCDGCHVLPQGLVHATQAQGRVTFSGLAATAAWSA